MMLLSIIIPTCNRFDLLTKCLDGLSPKIQESSSQLKYEVIVTDDSSNDNTKIMLQKKYPEVLWVAGPCKGPAANRNNGASKASGDWLIFIDDDCHPDKNILSEYMNAILANPLIRAFEGRIYVNEPKSSFLHESPLNESGGFFWSCNICIERNLFEELNGFDSNFPFAAMEDVDFFRRMKVVTNKHMFVYEAAVMHPWRVNHKLIHTTLNRHASQLFYLEKHPKEKKRLNANLHFRYFAKNNIYLMTHAWKYRFSGFGKLLYCNFLQLYFGITTLIQKKTKN